MHRRFRIGIPKINRWFCIGPPQVTLNMLPLKFNNWWILVYHGYYERKSTKLPIWNRMAILNYKTLQYWNSTPQYCSFYFKHGFLLLFLHNSHGTKEIPDCCNLVRTDRVGNLRWDNTEPYEPFRWVNTEPSVQFRKANTDPSVQFRKAMDPSMQFRWGHREFLFC